MAIFRIDILDREMNVLTAFFKPHYFNLKYSNEISKSGSASFSLLVGKPNVTPNNIKVWNRVRIWKDSKAVFLGFIDSIDAKLNTLEITCLGMLALFQKRIMTKAFTNKQAAIIFFDILADENLKQDTKIVQGISNVIYNVGKLDFKRSTVLSAWQKVATLASAEFEINGNGDLNFSSELGQDKSGQLIFQYISSQINSANLQDFEVSIQSKDMVNSVLGYNNSTSYTATDALKKDEFGLLQEQQNFSQTGTLNDLTAETTRYLNLRKEEFYVPKIQPLSEKIDPDSYEAGDIIKLIISNGFITLNQNQRIVKKEVIVSNNDTIETDISLTPLTANLLPSDIFSEIVSQERRIALLESLI